MVVIRVMPVIGTVQVTTRVEGMEQVGVRKAVGVTSQEVATMAKAMGEVSLNRHNSRIRIMLSN